MIRKLMLKIRDKIFAKHYRKLDALHKKVNELNKKLDDQKKQTTNLKNYVGKELKRRDLWPVKAAEVKWLAKGKPIWVIKSPEPDTNEKFVWGEYNFSRALKREIEKLGYYVVIEEYENWYCEVEADVVLVLRGPHDYHPDRRNAKCKYILWHLTHPNTMSKEEYELYDMVFVNSLSYAKEMAKQVSVPVEPLLVCADMEIFQPAETDEANHEFVFVGNTRRVQRDFVLWCENHKIPLRIWGEPGGWKKYVKQDSSIELQGIIDNKDLPELYRKSKIILNDHFEDMRNNGFMNNRLLEVLACGRPLLSDYHPDYEEVLGDGILFYKNEEEFLEKLADLKENYDEHRRRVLAMWPRLQEEFSFEARAKELVHAAKRA